MMSLLGGSLLGGTGYSQNARLDEAQLRFIQNLRNDPYTNVSTPANFSSKTLRRMAAEALARAEEYADMADAAEAREARQAEVNRLCDAEYGPRHDHR